MRLEECFSNNDFKKFYVFFIYIYFTYFFYIYICYIYIAVFFLNFCLPKTNHLFIICYISISPDFSEHLMIRWMMPMNSILMSHHSCVDVQFLHQLMCDEMFKNTRFTVYNPQGDHRWNCSRQIDVLKFNMNHHHRWYFEFAICLQDVCDGFILTSQCVHS